MLKAALLLLVSCAIAVVVGEGLARRFLIVRDVGPAFSEYDPRLGKVHKKSFHAVRWTPEFTMTFTSNSLGFRGPDPDGEPRDAVEILFLGDSFTEGYGVDDGEEFPRIVASRLARDGTTRPVRVTNAGVGDTGAARALRFLTGYRPRGAHAVLVVYQFSPNDFADTAREGYFRVDDDGTLVEARDPAPLSLVKRVYPLLEDVPLLTRSHLFAAIRQLLKTREVAGAGQGRPRQKDDALTFRVVERLVRTARARGWALVGLVFDVEGHRAFSLNKVLSRYRCPVIELPSKAARPDLYYAIDGHWNRRGHAYVADRALPVIESELPRLDERVADQRG